MEEREPPATSTDLLSTGDTQHKAVEEREPPATSTDLLSRPVTPNTRLWKKVNLPPRLLIYYRPVTPNTRLWKKGNLPPRLLIYLSTAEGVVVVSGTTDMYPRYIYVYTSVAGTTKVITIPSPDPYLTLVNKQITLISLHLKQTQWLVLGDPRKVAPW